MISGIVWHGITHHWLNNDAVGQKIVLIVKEDKHWNKVMQRVVSIDHLQGFQTLISADPRWHHTCTKNNKDRVLFMESLYTKCKLDPSQQDQVSDFDFCWPNFDLCWP